MKAHLIELVGAAGPGQGRNVAREYLQARILGILQREGAMAPLAFQGGTCLRFLFNLPRYSEDLDFTLEGDPASYDLRGWLTAVRAQLSREGYEVGLAVRDRNPVHSAFVRFPGVLHEAGLSPRREESLAIRIEVDTRPPSGAVLESRLVRRHVTLRLHHHDRASLLAGKLHALLQRPYTKGRDLYDLIWYLSDPRWPAPNFALLNTALRQTGWDGDILQADNWRTTILGRLDALEWQRVAADVRPFLERAEDVALVTQRERGAALDPTVVTATSRDRLMSKGGDSSVSSA